MSHGCKATPAALFLEAVYDEENFQRPRNLRGGGYVFVPE
jgi:hypothetical protein